MGFPRLQKGGRNCIEFLKRFRAERCGLESPFAEGIHSHDPGTAGVGDDGQLASGGPLHLAQGLRTTEELTDSVHPDNSRTAKRCIVGFILPASAPVCEAAALAAASLRPDLTTMMGLTRETERAALMNLRCRVMFSM